MSDLRIFSYLPNPRLWKATITARLCGVSLEIRGAPPKQLGEWLWDFDARVLAPGERAEAEALARTGRVGFAGKSLLKTDAFLDAHPFGTVPAAFSPDGTVGIFESNSIMRAVARLGAARCQLYGQDPYSAARIDSFLDAGLIFGRDNQDYLLALLNGAVSAEVHRRARDAFHTYAGGIDRALAPARAFLVGDGLSLADICFVAEFALFGNETRRHQKLKESGLAPILHDGIAAEYPRATAHFRRLAAHPAFAPDVGPYLEKLEKTAA